MSARPSRKLRARRPPSPAPDRLPVSRDSLGAPWLFALAACLLLVALLGARCLRDFDLGFSLRTGQWIAEHRAVPRVDDYTYTVAGRPYVDSSWLYQLALFALQSALGYPALTLVNVLLLLGVFGFTFLRARLAGTPAWAACLLLGAAVLSCETRFQVRAEIVSWLLLVSSLLVLDLRVRLPRLLALLPLIQLLWVNTEGLFILGWIVVAAYHHGDWVHARHVDRRLLTCGLLSVVASFLNPYTVQEVLQPFTLVTRLEGANLFKQNIVELQSPWSIVPSGGFGFVAGLPLTLYKGLGVLALLLLLLTVRRRRLHELLLVPAFFLLSVSAERNTPLFVLVALPVIGASIGELRGRWLRAAERRVLARPVMALGLSGFFLLAGVRVVTNAHYVADRRDDRFGLGLDAERLPVAAARFLQDRGLGGRILNQLNSGGWLIWQGRTKVFIDGQLEVMGEDFFADYLTAFRPGGLARLAARYRADLILFNPKAASDWIVQLAAAPGWRMVYADGYFVIYARAGYAPAVPAVDLWANLSRERIPAAAPDSRALLEPAVPSGLASWLEGFYRSQLYPERLMDLGLISYLGGRADVAEPIFLEIIRRSRGRYPEFFYNLGLACLQTGRRGLAVICMRRALEANPRDELARRVLRDL